MVSSTVGNNSTVDEFINTLHRIENNSHSTNISFTLKPAGCLSAEKLKVKSIEQNGNQETFHDEMDNLDRLLNKLDLLPVERTQISNIFQNNQDQQLTTTNLENYIQGGIAAARQPINQAAPLIQQYGITVRPGDPVTQIGNTGITVNHSDGTLDQVPNRDYVRGGNHGDYQSASNAYVWATGSGKTNAAYLGTSSMSPCYPIIAFLTDPGGNPQAFLYHSNGTGFRTACRELENLEQQGYTINRIITGAHTSARNQAQYAMMVEAHEYAQNRNIPISFIKYDDAGRGAWWMDIDVQNQAITIGN